MVWCLESVAVSAGVLGTDTVLCRLGETVHTGNAVNKNVIALSLFDYIVLKSYPAPSIIFLRLQ